MESNLLEYINGMEFYADVFEENKIVQEAGAQPPFRDLHLKLKLADVEDFIKKNDVKEITNPVFFVKEGQPTSDGLLSYEIFGITKEERSNIWGYIDLHGTYLHPLVYKIWKRMDSAIDNIVYGLKSYVLDSNGYITEDPKGESGIKFLIKNIDKIDIKETDSYERKTFKDFIMANKKNIFIKKMLVQPAFFRDVLSKNGRTEVGQLNKYYSNLLILANSIKETQDLGFSLGEATQGRIQSTILDIYKCVTGTSDKKEDGTGLSGKLGIISMAGLGKTVDYATRLVLSAPELRVETLDDLMVDTEHCALPLASAIVNFKPFIVFNIKRFFENEFGGATSIAGIDKNGKLFYAKAKDPQSVYSDQNIEKQLKKFIYGFSNRFEAVSVPVETDDGKEMIINAAFKGRYVTPEQYEAGDIEGESALINRALTWCDVFYMAACEAVQDKCVLVTRYPIDSAYNQIPQKVHISTIKNTEPIYTSGRFYRWYPKIRSEDIGTNTSNKFIDTLNICNLLLEGMGGDYDGDTVSIKGVWLQESNKELFEFLSSKSHYINFSGTCNRMGTHEAAQSIFSMTKILSADLNKMSDPVF